MRKLLCLALLLVCLCACAAAEDQISIELPDGECLIFAPIRCLVTYSGENDPTLTCYDGSGSFLWDSTLYMSTEKGVWETELLFEEPGTYTLEAAIEGEDGRHTASLELNAVSLGPLDESTPLILSEAMPMIALKPYTLSWNAVPGAASYQAFLTMSDGITSTRSGPLTGTSHTFSDSMSLRMIQEFAPVTVAVEACFPGRGVIRAERTQTPLPVAPDPRVEVQFIGVPEDGILRFNDETCFDVLATADGADQVILYVLHNGRIIRGVWAMNSYDWVSEPGMTCMACYNGNCESGTYSWYAVARFGNEWVRSELLPMRVEAPVNGTLDGVANLLRAMMGEGAVFDPAADLNGDYKVDLADAVEALRLLCE